MMKMPVPITRNSPSSMRVVMGEFRSEHAEDNKDRMKGGREGDRDSLAKTLPSTAKIHSAAMNTLADGWWFIVMRQKGVNVPAMTM